MTATNYGFLNCTNDSTVIRMRKGQNIAGYSVGIMFLDDVWYPIMPGNVVNAYTYDFPVRLKAVPNLDALRLHSGDPLLAEEIVAVARELVEKEGCRAISAACGFFGHFQTQVAEAVDVPVCLSSLMQASWIKAALKKNQKIGVLSANASAITTGLMQSCGIDDPSFLLVKDLRNEPEFSAIMENRGSFDNAGVRREAVAAALDLVKSDRTIGAILLECSDLPPYSADIQRATGLPVFDFITMIKWLHNATTQKPYQGFI